MIAPLPTLGPDWSAHFSGDEAFERIFGGFPGYGEEGASYLTRYPASRTRTDNETTENEKRDDEAEPPLCMAGRKTQHPCRREASSRLGKVLLCDEHSRIPGASEEISEAEGAVWYIQRFQTSADKTGNALLIGLLEGALDEAEDHRVEAYQKLEVPRRIRGG